MVESRTNLLGVSDLYAMPDDEFHHELVRGQLVSEPPPGARHGRVASRIVYQLQRAALGSDFIVVTCDAGFILHRSPDTVRAPDVALVSRNRYLALEDESRLIPGAPDLAVEVLSPRNTRAEMHEKVADYLAAGTAMVWVADPQSKVVVTYRDILAPRSLAGSDMLPAGGLLRGFRIAVSELFAL